MTVKSWMIEGDELVVQLDGVTSRFAAGPLTQQLIPMIAAGQLEADELQMLEMVCNTFGGCAGVIVRARE